MISIQIHDIVLRKMKDQTRKCIWDTATDGVAEWEFDNVHTAVKTAASRMMESVDCRMSPGRRGGNLRAVMKETVESYRHVYAKSSTLS